MDLYLRNLLLLLLCIIGINRLSFAQDFIMTKSGSKIYGELKQHYITHIKFKAEGSKRGLVYTAEEIQGFYKASQNAYCSSRMLGQDKESLFFPDLLPENELRVYQFTEGRFNIWQKQEQAIFVFTYTKAIDMGLRKECRDVFIRKAGMPLHRWETRPDRLKQVNRSEDDYFIDLMP